MFFENLTFIEIVGKNVAERDRPQMTIWSMRISCRIPEATNIHSDYVTLVTFSQQQQLHVGASILRNAYIAFLLLRRCEFREENLNLLSTFNKLFIKKGLRFLVRNLSSAFPVS